MHISIKHILVIGLLMIVPVHKDAKAQLLPPVPICLTTPLTYIPMWSIINGHDIECFVGQPPVEASTTYVLTPVIPVIVRLIAADGKTVVAVSDPTQPLHINHTKNPSFSAFDVTVASPIFATHDYTLGSTDLGTLQYGEMTERASFWKYPGAKVDKWFVKLSLWPFSPAVTLDVPSGSYDGMKGEADAYVVDQTILGDFVKKHAQDTAPGVLPIFLFYNIGTYTGTLQSPTSCCALGDHKPYAVNGITSFYIWASYMDPPISETDVLPLSHEVAEFLHDPFLTNLAERSYPTPGTFPLPWNPTYAFKKCSTLLEVADAVEDRPESKWRMSIDTSIMTYHVTNIATASWFLQASPSFSVNGWYTLKGAIDGEFNETAPLCISPGS